MGQSLSGSDFLTKLLCRTIEKPEEEKEENDDEKRKQARKQRKTKKGGKRRREEQQQRKRYTQLTSGKSVAKEAVQTSEKHKIHDLLTHPVLARTWESVA